MKAPDSDATGASMTPLAVIGIGCLFPRADGLGAYWANIKSGADSITEVPPSHWRPEDYLDADPKSPDRTYAARGGFLEPTPFAPGDFGIAPNSLEATDTSQLLGLVVARQALADAGYPVDGTRAFDRRRVAVILGVTGTLELVIPLGARLGHPLWRRALREAGVADEVAADVVERIAEGYVGWQENSFPGLLGNVVAGRIANRFDLGGTNCVVDAACASSLSALHLAGLELATGRADMVVTGGVDTFNDIFMYMCFSKTPALSPTGNARPFDAAGDGTILGEGLGMVVLKRLDDARRDGDRVYAVIRGLGTSSDGKGNAVYAPKAAGQIEALQRAYAAAGITPDTIELVEAHGTGTRVGDATEVAALTQVYETSGRRGRWCALGSVKSQIGHTKAAAGAAGLIKVVAALHHKVLPPTIKVRQPLEALQGDETPFYLNTEKRPWLSSQGQPRRAAVSAFGFGGSNFHAVVEEAKPEKSEADWDGDVQIIALAGADTAALERALEQWPVDLAWPELRWRAAQSRAAWQSSAPCRLLLVVQRQRTDMAKTLAAARAALGRSERTSLTPDGVFFGRDVAPGGLAVLFPGQGAQYPGMLRDLACQFPEVFDALADADRAFAADNPSARLSDLIYPPGAFTDAERQAQIDALRATDVAQPALGAAALGAWRLLQQRFGVEASAAAGHSFGELAALCAAGWIGAAEFHKLARLRGRLMAQAGAGVPSGMLAVEAPLATLTALLHDEQLDLVLANKNAPQQTVLSGAVAQIERAAAACQRLGLRAQRLSVAAGFHSPFVAAAAAPFRAALEDVLFRSSPLQVYANSTARPYPADAAGARDLLGAQLAQPVEFVAQIEALHQAGMHTFLEVGPGARLTGLVSAILRGRPHSAFAVDASAGKRSGQFDLACALAALAALGHPVRLNAWDDAAPSAPEAARKPTLTVTLTGANYVKPREPRPARSPSSKTAPPPARPVSKEDVPTTMNNGVTPPRSAPLANGSAAHAAAAPALSQALQLTRDSLAALQKIQEQNANLHRQYLDSQDSVQRSVQQLVEQQQRILQATLGLPSAPVLAPPAIAMPAPVQPSIAPLVNGASTAAPPAPPTLRPVAEPTKPAVAAASTPPAAERTEVEKVLLEVIADKTGYPAEMLDLDMVLDADLGIDSIKRVEILSALQDRLPHAPVVKPEHLGTLHNLRQIAAFLANGQADSSPAPVAAPSTPAADETVQKVLLEVIADKTGYPAEMLDLDMVLDADLGIDSIKRVEILSALQDRLPNAPVVTPEHLGTLHNLRQIVAFLNNGKPAAAPTGSRSASKDTETPTPKARSASRDADVESSLERSVLRLVPLDSTQAPRLAPGAEIWITKDDPALAADLDRVLQQLGYSTRLLRCTALRTEPPPAALGGLVVIAPLTQVPDEFLAAALFGAQHLAPALRRGESFFATVSRLDGGFGLLGLDANREPLDGGLAGLTKTAGHEWPEVACKAFDLGPGVGAEDLVDHLLSAGPPEIGITKDGAFRLERVLQVLPASTAPNPLRPGDVVVVTGGARGVTAAAAVALAEAWQPTLVLLGRSPAPQSEPAWLAPLETEAEIKRELANRLNGDSPRLLGERCRQVLAEREIRTTLTRCTAAGAQVVYRAVDVADAAAVAQVLDEVRRAFGPIRGLVHGAGVLADALIVDKTAEQFQRVYGTKVHGLRALLAGLAADDLRVLALFSSSTARFGRKGQVDYAIANEVLNKLARREALRRPGCRVVSLNWGPWDGGMVKGGLKKIFADEGIALIGLTAGAALLIRELQGPVSGEAEVVVLGAPLPEPVRRAPDMPQPVPSALPIAFERLLDLAEYPVLESHVLDGRPVLPLALMIEWLAHAALHENPGLLFHGCNDIHVLKGVIPDDGPPPRLRLCAGKATRRDGCYVAPVELRSLGADEREVLHARGEIVLVTELPAAPSALDLPPLGPYGPGRDKIYRSLLFHGPDLQGIDEVEACGAAGILARVHAAPLPGAWLHQPLRHKWLGDPLVLDSAFQALILWGLERHKTANLPVRTGRYRQYRRAFPAEVRVAARIARHTGLQTLADVDFLDRDGLVVARFEGYECVHDAALQRAFRRNRLAQPALP